jgi:hypothetical protein
VLDRVRVVGAGLLEESLEVVYWRSRLALDAAFNGFNALHVGVVHLLVVIIVEDGCGYDPLRAPLPPLLAAFDILLGTLDGDDARHHLAVAGGYLPAA